LLRAVFERILRIQEFSFEHGVLLVLGALLGSLRLG
jgi:hypothetical protein